MRIFGGPGPAQIYEIESHVLGEGMDRWEGGRRETLAWMGMGMLLLILLVYSMKPDAHSVRLDSLYYILYITRGFCQWR